MHYPQLVILACLVATQLFGQIPTVTIGRIERLENFSSQYVDARNVDVWLPKGYDSAHRYPVLYMQDGQMLFDSTINWNHQEWNVDETLGQLMQKKAG